MAINELNGIEEIVLRLGWPEAAADLLRTHWADAERAFPGTMPTFLDEAEFAVSRAWSGLDAALDPTLAEAARRIVQDPLLLRLAWYAYWQVFESPYGAPLVDWLPLEPAYGDLAGLFTLLVGLAVVPRMRVHHRRLGVPQSVTRETCAQVRCFCENYRQAHEGASGIFVNQLGWLRHYTREPYFRLGRLEYWAKPFGGGIHIYRSRKSGDVIALAEDGVRFNRDGYIDRTDAEADGWTASYREDGDSIVGVPISPFGMAERQQVRLSRETWQPVLVPGDPILDMHIPAGGGMSPRATQDSMHRASAFFARYFPERSPIAFLCYSWIFNNQLEEILPATANLVQYMRQLYLFPVPSNGRDGLWFIFLTNDVNPETAPRRTSLQRAILDYLAVGHRWRGGGMFYLLDDLPHLGSEHYRRHYPPAELA